MSCTAGEVVGQGELQLAGGSERVTALHVDVRTQRFKTLRTSGMDFAATTEALVVA